VCYTKNEQIQLFPIQRVTFNKRSSFGKANGAESDHFYQEDSDMKGHKFLVVVMVLLLAGSFQACSSSSSSGTVSPSGSLSVMVTDAPGDFDNVYITVKSVRFHTSDVADPRAGDWLTYPLTPPVTVDLLSLANGNMQSLWNNIQLPVGTYKQIRLHLVPTFTANPPTGHQNYNEVVIGGTAYPLHVPDANDGIKLAGTFAVTAGSTLRLAIDFNAAEDIVELHEGTDFVLKPRLGYFDLDHAGAIIGKLSTGPMFLNSGFVIKAERLATAKEMLNSGSTYTYHVVRRWTVPESDGSFVLYPVSTLVTGTWDVVIRGLNTETMIIKEVPITNGATPTSGATDLGTIITSPTNTPNNDYPVAGTIQSPTGAWVQFYQTLQAPGEYPYEIRFRHFNPLWGGFRKTFMLNNDQIQVGTFVSNSVISTLTATSPREGIGGYKAVAGAILFDRFTLSTLVTSSTMTVAFTSPLTVMSPYHGNTVSGSITMSNSMMNNKMDSGLLFAVQGGMIVNAIRVDNQMTGMMSNSYNLTNLPGGTSSNVLPGAFYGIDAVGWTASPSIYKAIALPQIVDLRQGDDTANMNMLPLW
jgi:hypothetical protein